MQKLINMLWNFLMAWAEARHAYLKRHQKNYPIGS